MVSVMGDPRAGSPQVRVALHRGKAPAQGVAPGAGMQAFTVDSLGMYQDLTTPGFELNNQALDPGRRHHHLPRRRLGRPSVPGAGTSVAQPPLPPPRRGARRPAARRARRRPGPAEPAWPAARGRPRRRPTLFSAYARPRVQVRTAGPRVALIVGGLGLNPASTKAAIERLPAEVTLSFVPYAQGLQGWIDLARANGHEVMIEIPMEPADYPDNDPGPLHPALSTASPQDTAKRLDWLLSRATGYFAVTNYLGQKFVASDPGMGAFLGELKARGVGFIDDGSARRRRGGFARASADAVIDDQLSADAIAAQLSNLEQTAKVKGSAAWRRLRLSGHRRRGGGPLDRRPEGQGLATRAGIGHRPSVSDQDPNQDLSHYRANVGIVVFNRAGLVWLGRRHGVEPPHNWQFPQGGVDKGEVMEAAARRELLEETGISSVAFLAAAEGWVFYDYPPGYGGSKAARGYLGQKQKWFAYRFEGEDSEVDLEAHHEFEFDAWKWARLHDAFETVVPFKRASYARVIEAFGCGLPRTKRSDRGRRGSPG